MTAKEKAENLIDNYLVVRNEFNETLYFSEAKKCALIAVNELIELEIILKNGEPEPYYFYKEVKKEIEKL